MSEQSISNYPITVELATSAFDTLNPDMQVVAEAREATLRVLQDRGLDPATVLFAGYNPGTAKPADGEFALDTGQHQFYFGDFASMAPPAVGDDEELAGEKWAVNPLHYALGAGQVLGIYDQGLLAPHLAEVDEEFGTYLLEATEDQIAACRIAEVRFAEPAHKQTQEK